jgi:hypothetical protein
MPRHDHHLLNPYSITIHHHLAHLEQKMYVAEATALNNQKIQNTGAAVGNSSWTLTQKYLLV